jgi:sigma-B regulation protein RsbU (phosphoserine phosphatase)
VRAGHEPAILYDPATGRHTFLKGAGPALGMDADSRFERNRRVFREGQILCLFTDGICEVRDARGEMFGRQRLCRAIERYADAAAKTIMLSILDEVEAHGGAAESQDDLTLVVVKYANPVDVANRRS